MTALLTLQGVADAAAGYALRPLVALHLEPLGGGTPRVEDYEVEWIGLAAAGMEPAAIHLHPLLHRGSVFELLRSTLSGGPTVAAFDTHRLARACAPYLGGRIPGPWLSVDQLERMCGSAHAPPAPIPRGGGEASLVGDRAALTLRRAQAALNLSLSLGLTGAHALESQTSHTLARMEQRGLHVNASALAATASASERLADECDRQIIRMQREPQTAERDTEIRAALQAHAKHVRAVKTANAIAGSLIRGRVHSNFDAGGAATGRITSSGPNLQNLGPALRSCVDAAGGNVIVVGDWQQFEPRIVAAYTGEPLLTEAFALGVDVYEAIASDMGCTRSEAKAIFLSSMFEGGPALVSKRLGCSPRKARAFIERHRSQMRLVESFRHRMVTRALGELPTHAVVLPSGRRRTIHGLESGEKRELAKARRQVFNTIIQGTAAEALKETITRLDAQLEEAGAGHLVLTVYDEIAVETPARHEGLVRRLLRDSMQHAHSIPAHTPAKVGAGLTLEAARANSS